MSVFGIGGPEPFDLVRKRLWERQRCSLERMLALLIERNPFWKGRLEGIPPGSIRAPEDLQTVPLLEKDELLDDQVQHPPYGTNLSFPLSCYVRLHQTSGTTRAVPVRFLDTRESWARFVDMWVRIYEACGVTDRDRIFLPFSFGPFIGFWGAFEAALQIGAFVVTGGGMSTRARIRAILEHQITVLPATPTYALHMAEQAAADGIRLADSSVRLLIVAGEPGGSIPAVRERIREAWGAQVRDHWGMTEVGALGYECPVVERRMHLFEEDCIAEVVDPQTGRPVAPGSDGELVITTLWRPGQPVIRYRTGDIVRLAPHQRCPCGVPWIGLDGGILGRRDHMVFIRGNNVYPTAIEEVIRSVPEVAEYEAVVTRRGALTELTLRIEPVPEAEGMADTICKRIQELIRDRFYFRAEVVAVPPGNLPRWELKARRWKVELAN